MMYEYTYLQLNVGTVYCIKHVFIFFTEKGAHQSSREGNRLWRCEVVVKKDDECATDELLQHGGERWRAEAAFHWYKNTGSGSV